MNENRIRIGAINWDAALPKNTYFGGFALRNLGTDKYCEKLPYFAQKTENGYEINFRTQDEYDFELSLAYQNGIDFFAYCWYPDTAPETRTVWRDTRKFTDLLPYLPELNFARKLYQKSPLNKKIGMCAIMFSNSAYSPSDIDDLLFAMEQDYYEKIDGRPLIIIYGGYNGEFIRLLKNFAATRNLTPYFAFVDNGGYGDITLDYSEADAVTAYASCNPANTFDELTNLGAMENEKRLTYKMSAIPMLSMGWNPTPRVDNPSPWVNYKDLPYADLPNEAEIEYAFKSLDDFITQNKEQLDTGLALVFAWNEFEEGGYLCPTLNPDGGMNDTLLKTFAKVREKYK